VQVPQIFIENLHKAGKYSLVAAIIIVSLNHWKFLTISPTFLDFLYFYILVNGIAASPFFYFEKRKRVSRKVCPKCGEYLIITPQFECPECGKITYVKE